jgi:hypothetical protein
MNFKQQDASTPHVRVTTSSDRSGMLRRKCDCGGAGPCDCPAEEPMQRSATGPQPSGGVPSIVGEVIGSGGHPLDDGTRGDFESRFGVDFSSVRIHTGSRASESAHAVNALAYTVGRNIVFADGHFAPNSSRGARLLAHELTHVVQGGEHVVASSADTISNANDPAEADADRVADEVMNDRSGA